MRACVCLCACAPPVYEQAKSWLEGKPNEDLVADLPALPSGNPVALKLLTDNQKVAVMVRHNGEAQL